MCQRAQEDYDSCVLGIALLLAVQPAAGQDLAVRALPGEPFVGQEVLVTWTLEIPPAHRARGLAQRFRRPLELPVEFSVGELSSGTLTWRDTDGIELVRNGAVTRAMATGLETPAEDLRVVLEANWAPREPGAFVLPPAVARYGLEAPAGGLGLGIGGALEEVAASVPAMRVTVRPVPESGRPLGYTGSVGRPTARWEEAEGLVLRLQVEDGMGGGPPRWDPGPGWEASGPVAGPRGLHVYTLRAAGPWSSAPRALAWPWFDPEAEQFQILEVALPALDLPPPPKADAPVPAALERSLLPILLAWAGVVVCYWWWDARPRTTFAP